MISEPNRSEYLGEIRGSSLLDVDRVLVSIRVATPEAGQILGRLMILRKGVWSHKGGATGRLWWNYYERGAPIKSFFQWRRKIIPS